MRKFHNYKKSQNFIVLIVLLCVAIIGTFTQVTLSWLMDTSTTSSNNNYMLVGTVDLDVETNFNFRYMALAPDTEYLVDTSGNSMETTIKTSAKHTADGAYVRIKFECDRDELTLLFADNKITNTTATTYSASFSNRWIYNTGDQYYYYLGYVAGTAVQFNMGYYVDNTLVNSKSGEDCNVHFTIEAIQRQYGASNATWTTSPAIFKSFVTTDEGIKHN